MPLPQDAAADDLMPIRLDDGRSGGCGRDDRIAPGDRIYRVVYQGRNVEGRIGIDFHDSSSGADQVTTRAAALRASGVYAAMAVAPALLLCALLAMRIGGARGAGVGAALLAVLAAALVPVAIGGREALRVRRHNRRASGAMEECRRLARSAIDEDVAAWKERLGDAAQAHGATVGSAVVRGTACRIVEGVVDARGGAPTLLLRQGRPLPLPPEAVSECGIEEGQIVHAMVPAGRIPAVPVAVSSPATGRVWTDPGLVGGRDGSPYRAEIRAALGRTAWRLITTQWDEIGRRRRTGRRA
jgi:hypothetical protein